MKEAWGQDLLTASESSTATTTTTTFTESTFAHVCKDIKELESLKKKALNPQSERQE
jgi:hypothetical protein